MTLDQSKIGQVTAALMDVLDAQGLPDGAEIGSVLLTVEVNWPGGSQVTSQMSDHRINANLGLLEVAKAQFLGQLSQGG